MSRRKWVDVPEPVHNQPGIPSFEELARQRVEIAERGYHVGWPVALMTCGRCGCVVNWEIRYAKAHDEWHDRIESIERGMQILFSERT